ncbi:MAG: 6-bladed beta-propeller [Balneolaceae bacterium]
MNTWRLLCLFISISTIGCVSNDGSELPDLSESIRNGEDLSVYPANPEISGRIEFVREQTFGGAGEVFFQAMLRPAVDESGRVYLGDRLLNVIHVYQPTGEYVTSMGAAGRGPGEFMDLSNIEIQSNRLYAFDPRQFRISIFNLDYALIEVSDESVSHAQVVIPLIDTILIHPEGFQDIRKPEDTFPPHIFVGGKDGTYIVQLRSNPVAYLHNAEYEGTVRYYRLDEDGFIHSDNIFEQALPSPLFHSDQRFAPFVPPYIGSPLVAFSNRGELYWTGAEEFLVSVHNTAGEFSHAFYHPFDRQMITLEEARNSIQMAALRPSVVEPDLPDSWPALEEMFIDDENRLWVSTIVEDFDIYEWWVLEDTGELITKFEWPRDEPIELVKNGYMYTRETEEETGLQQIIRYRIEMEES